MTRDQDSGRRPGERVACDAPAVQPPVSPDAAGRLRQLAVIPVAVDASFGQSGDFRTWALRMSDSPEGGVDFH